MGILILYWFGPSAYQYTLYFSNLTLTCLDNTKSRWKLQMVTNNENWVTRVTLLQKLSDRDNDDAWRDFVAYYRGFIYGLIRRMGLSHSDADEVVQLVLLKSWNKLPDFCYDPARGKFRGWLGRVTGNTAKNYLRDSTGRYVALENEDGIAVNEKEFFSSESEIDRLAEEEWREYLPKLAWKNICGEFGDNVRRVYQLLHDEKTTEEIAAEVGIAVSSVYVYKKRIQDKLSAEIRRLERELG